MNTAPNPRTARFRYLLARLAAVALIVASIASAIGIDHSPSSADAWTVEITLGILQLALFAAGVILLLLGRHLSARERESASGMGT
jgi:hypothetical protein